MDWLDDEVSAEELYLDDNPFEEFEGKLTKTYISFLTEPQITVGHTNCTLLYLSETYDLLTVECILFVSYIIYVTVLLTTQFREAMHNTKVLGH